MEESRLPEASSVENPVSTHPTHIETSPTRRGRIIAFATATTILGVVATVAGLRIARAASQAADTAHIAPGVKIAGIPVGGMTKDEATKKIRAWARQQSQTPVTLTAPVSGRKWNLPLSDVGGRFDVDAAVTSALAVGRDDSLWQHLMNGGRERVLDVKPVLKLSEPTLEKQIAAIGKAVYKAPVNAKAKITDMGEVQVAAPEQKGVEVDIAATKAALLKGGTDALRDGEQATLAVKVTEPKVTADQIGQLTQQIGTFSTDYSSSSSNRKHNIGKATGKISGTLLAPGDIFSYNTVVGPRYTRLGWRDAPTYQDGQVVPGPGGGICQTSTTLYNAVLRANLKIVARAHHSMPVHYVPAGCDATVDYPSIDFKFQNSTESPVLIVAKANGAKLTYTLFADPEANKPKVEIVSGRRVGNSMGGVTVTTYKVVKNPDGSTSREALSTDSYRPHGASASKPRRRSIVRPAASKPATPASAPAVSAPTAAEV
jgi:vancomycin resistance protein YoaR